MEHRIFRDVVIQLRYGLAMPQYVWHPCGNIKARLELTVMNADSDKSPTPRIAEKVIDRKYAKLAYIMRQVV